MINIFEVAETNEMIEKENLDVRTITLGISLLDCIDSDLKILNEKIYQKIYEAAKDLVATGEQNSDCKQAYCRYPDCINRRGSLPDERGFCFYCTYFG